MRVVPEGCDLIAGHTGVVALALRYFARHFQESILMADVARSIGTSEECLDFCFDQTRGMTPFEALQQHRLNRLFQAIAAQPRLSLPSSMRRCGLPCSAGTVAAFEHAFGIGMPLFRRTCQQAADDRQQHFISSRPSRPSASALAARCSCRSTRG